MVKYNEDVNNPIELQIAYTYVKLINNLRGS